MAKTMAEESQSRRRKVLYDSPVSSDEFSGGGHRKTASALANTIREFEDETRSIGLEGKWGSGKSTIVEIAKTELHAHSARKHHVFTFDLWTNQNGSFRRSFLESLLSWLERIDDSKSAFTSATRDRIRDRTVDTRTEHVKVFSGFGILILAFVVSLPWLYSWLSPAAIRSDKTPVLTWVALAIMSFVLLVTTVKAALNYRAARSSQDGARKGFAAILSETIAVFTKDAQMVHIKQNIREVDPTQNEFEAILKGILSEFQRDGRRIIVVFDNIDRLPSDKIVEAWSDIRSVLSSRRDNDDRTENLTVIVPYDRMHILRAMHSDSEISAINKDDTFRKSFDAIFFVAPPVISDSVQFFNAKLKIALGVGFDEGAAYLVYKIFALSRSDEVATPRQVIAFINAISSLWEQWGDKIPLATVAVFIVHRDKIEHNPDTLRKPDSIDLRYQDLSGDPDLFKNLAALAFNVEPDLAYQVLLNRRLEEVFTSTDHSDVEWVASSPGFDVILPEVYRECAMKWAKDSLTQFCNAASNLALLDVRRNSVSQSKRYLIEALPELSAGSPQDWEKSTGLLSIYSICTPEEATKVTAALVSWTRSGLAPKFEDRKFLHGRLWMDFIAEALSKHGEAISHKAASDAYALVRTPQGVGAQLGAMLSSAVHNLDIKVFDNADVNWVEVAIALDELIENDPQTFATIWPQVNGAIDESRVPGYLEKLATMLKGGDHIEFPAHLLALLEGFLDLFEATGRSDASVAERKSLVESGSLYHIAYAYKDSNDETEIKARAAALFTVLDCLRARAIPDASIHHPDFGDLGDDQDYVRALVSEGEVDASTEAELVEYTRRFPRLGSWIVAAVGSPSRNGLYKRIIGRLLSEGRFVPPTPKVVISNYAFISSNFGEALSLDKLFKLTGEQPLESFEEVDPLTVPPELLLAISKRTEAGWLRVVTKVDEWLTSLDSRDWEKILENKSQELELTKARVGQIQIEPSRLRTPLADHLISVLSGRLRSDSGLDFLVDVLPPNSRDGIASDVLERAARSPVTPSGLELAVKHFPGLLSRIPYDSEPHTAALKFILPAIQSSALEGKHFLESNRDALRKAIAAGSASVRGQVQEFIGANSDEDGNDTKARRQSLREVLDLPPYIDEKPKRTDGGGGG